MAEKPSIPHDWLIIRDKLVLQAVQERDTDLLGRLAALPGGFGSDVARRTAWLYLLHVDQFSDSPAFEKCSSSDRDGLERHKDEEQVGRDTARAFVTYPSEIPRESKEALQADLHDLIVGILRRRPKLSYFQGYHDILSVLYLTFVPPQVPAPRIRSRSSSRSRRRKAESGAMTSSAKSAGRNRSRSPQVQPAEVPKEASKDRNTQEWRDLRRCAEAISLLRVRDAMGSGMEGMMGLLRLLKRILRVADPALARFSAHISPVPTLPFFALSWILCLFSHDVDSLEPVQRMFDWLLSRNPVSAVYLAVAILIAKKDQMLDLAKHLGEEAREDPTLLHPLFARLPPLHADIPGTDSDPLSLQSQRAKRGQGDAASTSGPRAGWKHANDPEINPYAPIPLSSIFELADKLMLRHPWDGAEIRGREIMGPGSVLCTYERELDQCRGRGDGDVAGGGRREERIKVMLDEAEDLVDVQVTVPEVADSEDEQEEEEDELSSSVSRIRKFRRLRIARPTNKLGTAIAVGVLLVGIGIALHGRRAPLPLRLNNGALGRWFSILRRRWRGLFVPLLHRSSRVAGAIQDSFGELYVR